MNNPTIIHESALADFAPLSVQKKQHHLWQKFGRPPSRPLSSLLSLCLGVMAISGETSAQEGKVEPSVATSPTADEPRAPSLESLIPTAEEKDARLGWWREARFGMFVHWGISALLGGEWEGKRYRGYGEHIQRQAQIPISRYHKEVAGKFTAEKFNADEWIKLAKEAGMGYFIITAKHHDGFAMYDSKVSDATIVKMTPFGRDPMKELRAACKKYGLKFGFYYSHAFDWGEENGPGNDWDFDNPGGDKTRADGRWWLPESKYYFPNFLPKARKYVDEKSIPQIQELVANYDPDIMWFDTPNKLPPEENLRVLAAARKAKPSMLINSRLIGEAGDYQSSVDGPSEFAPRAGDWEGIPTTNHSYGYNANDRSHKSPAFFIRLLTKCAARGGNLLLNMGPKGSGEVDAPDVAIFQGIGKWWAVNGESIRGTTRSPLAAQAWGHVTRKGNRLYLHVFQWPSDGKLVVGGLKTHVKKTWLLADGDKMLEVKSGSLDQIIMVPQSAPDEVNSVVVIDCESEPLADPVRVLSPTVPEDSLHVFDGKLMGRLRYGQGKSKDDMAIRWNSTKEAVVWKVRANEATSYEVSINYTAPLPTESKTVDGDAGQEIAAANRGAGGTGFVRIGGQELPFEITKQGSNIFDVLGKVTVKPGESEIVVRGTKVTGGELMQLRRVILKPLPIATEP